LPARKRFVKRSGKHVPTRRELRVIELVAEGVNNREIAKELRIGEKVIGNYLRVYVSLKRPISSSGLAT